MKCEVIAVGTELLLGQIVDTNSAYLGARLAEIGVDSNFQVKVGDNAQRLRDTIELSLSRSDAVIVCGGLGPTQDDITREVIAEVLGVPLESRPDLVKKIEARFSGRGFRMPANNLRQALVPLGCEPISIMPGTASGLVCPTEAGVIYALPGVPWEMKEMVEGFVLDDLRQRAGITAVIASRVLRTWGRSESGLAELLGAEIDRLDSAGEATLAFLASGVEGLKVRITAKAASQDQAIEVLNRQEQRLRAIIGDASIFGIDDTTMESAVLQACRSRGLKLAVAESLTGGMIGQRLTAHPGCSDVYMGSVVSYANSVKVDLLGTGATPAVSRDGAAAMAEGVARLLGADCSIATTGVAGPATVAEHPVGTVFMASYLDGLAEVVEVFWPYDRQRIREFTTITALNELRKRLVTLPI